MNYTETTFDDLFRLFHVSLENAPLFRDVPPLKPSPWLEESLLRGQGMALMSEKSRSETIVTPVLLECQNHLGPGYSVYSGVPLEVNGEMNLRGECDFILARSPKAPFLRAPLLVLVEANRGYVEGGIAQCAAQMLAARRFNEERDFTIPYIYGCVTTGEDWQFLRLQGTRYIQDTDRYYIHDLGKILGILTTMLRG